MSKKINDWDKVSIDRIDSSRGYSLDNVRLVCWIVNMVRNELTNQELDAVIADMRHIESLRKSLGRGGNWYTKLKQEEYKRIFGTSSPVQSTH